MSESCCAATTWLSAEELPDAHTVSPGSVRFCTCRGKRAAVEASFLSERVDCARGDMENRIKECQGDLFADRTSAATRRANPLRLWFAALAYGLLCSLRRSGLKHTQFAAASCGTLRLKLLKIAALVR